MIRLDYGRNHSSEVLCQCACSVNGHGDSTCDYVGVERDFGGFVCDVCVRHANLAITRIVVELVEIVQP
jgi:hypothetical protein